MEILYFKILVYFMFQIFYKYLYFKFSALTFIGEIARFSFVNHYYFVHIQLAIQEEKLRIEEETLYAVQRERARAAKQRKFLEVRGKDPKIYVLECLFISSS